MMEAKLTHLALHVRDMAQACHFYESYCQLHKVHARAHAASSLSGQAEAGGSAEADVVWLSERGKETQFVLVLIAGRSATETTVEVSLNHMGFAVSSREAVDAIAQRAERDGILVWPAREEPFPVGYYCGVRDPDGNIAEFSFGQPLGNGAEPWVQ